MQLDKLMMWVQIMTGLAVVLGLGLVIWELQQSRSVATAQLTSDGASDILQKYIADLGENPAQVFVKACKDPQSLTDEELRILRASHHIVLATASRPYRIHTRTGLYEEWEELADSAFRDLATVPGYAFWKIVRNRVPPELRERGDAVLATAMESVPEGMDCWAGEYRRQIENYEVVESD